MNYVVDFRSRSLYVYDHFFIMIFPYANILFLFVFFHQQ